LLRQVVESSSVVSIGYDRGSQMLEVEFRGGRVYRYVDVPHEVWAGLRQAESKGQFFQTFVRDRFEATRVA
jgi:lysyl-tRNA synthetase class 2